MEAKYRYANPDCPDCPMDWTHHATPSQILEAAEEATGAARRFYATCVINRFTGETGREVEARLDTHSAFIEEARSLVGVS